MPSSRPRCNGHKSITRIKPKNPKESNESKRIQKNQKSTNEKGIAVGNPHCPFFENHVAPNDLNRIFGASLNTVSIGNIFYIQI